MKAKKFLKEWKAMCASYRDCVDCRLEGVCGVPYHIEPKVVLKAVKEWAEENREKADNEG